ncbi:MAG: hypothetical protein GYA77_05675 [Candidatus Cloacimonetes bacterium]|jgi:hypothetical protein|nr:hypothetical protein [Candidatus Cloacimonadota bacterium]
MQLNYKEIADKIEQKLDTLFKESRSGISAREDSRAFGAMIEKKITKKWESICSELKYEHVKNPGKRTIYDFACRIDNRFFGFDVKTKDLDSKSYSDGGVCSIGNLLKFLANDHGVFMIVEFGHNKSTKQNNTRDIKYIRVAPFHTLPEDTYRIENLGTGQVRLNNPIEKSWDKLEWNRSYKDFFNIFCKLAIIHYGRVKTGAKKRIESIENFINDGYSVFRFIK